MSHRLRLTDGPAITLEQMLAAREQRAWRQQAWLQQHPVPLISLTLVVPGSIKQSSGSQFLFQQAVTAITALCESAHYPLLRQQTCCSACGNEALFSVAADALSLKTACIDLENKHPLGRLWDIDIISPSGDILSRTTSHQADRRCLLCQESAHACARSRKHSVMDLIQVMEDKLNAYQRNSPTL
ncbi:MAG: Apo-citrate lyase phosphoribosyl-dephospho-CoA transferase [Candidatus Erwinia impunctatus]|nr:Apo-citrate lyase phosphoribosyl-dephospho-CoA transferase [Culicoides impunctatus]